MAIKKKLDNPDIKKFITRKDEPIGGRRPDSERPDGAIPYSVSIEAHKDLCKQLGNGSITVDTNKAKESMQEQYTKERLAGRSGRGEKP